MTIFEKIVAGDIPAHKILEDDRFLAFLDVSPLRRGHTLVIPKKHTDFIFDMEDQDLGDMWVFAKPVAHAIKTTFKSTKVGVAVLGLEVRHAHIHLVPLNTEQDINFSNPKLHLSNDELAQIAMQIRSFL